MIKNLAFLLVLSCFLGNSGWAQGNIPPLDKASMALQQKDYETAAQILEELLEKDRKNPKALFLRALTFSKTGDTKSALKTVRKARRQDKENAEFRMYEGVFLQDLGKKSKAEKRFVLATELDSTLALAWYNLGVSRMLEGDYPQAIARLSRYLDLEPLDAEGWMTRAEFYFQADQLEKSMADLRKVQSLQAGHVASYFLEGRIYYRLQNFAEAAKKYTVVINAEPDNADALYNRGLAAYRIPVPEQAMEDFNAAIRLDPDNSDAWFARGKLKISHRMWQEAIADMLQSISMNPDDADAYFLTGRSYLEIKEFEKAVKMFDRGLKISPNDAEGWMFRGDGLEQGGDLNAAIKSWRKAANLGSPKAIVRLSQHER